MNSLMHNSTALTATAASRPACERLRPASYAIAAYPTQGHVGSNHRSNGANGVKRSECANPIFGGAARDFWVLTRTATQRSQRKRRL